MYYPTSKVIGEVLGILICFITSLIKLRCYSMGNKSENVYLFLIGFIFTIPNLIVYIYYLGFQTYVLVFDLLLNILGIILLVFEIIMGFYTMIKIPSNQKK